MSVHTQLFSSSELKQQQMESLHEKTYAVTLMDQFHKIRLKREKVILHWLWWPSFIFPEYDTHSQSQVPEKKFKEVSNYKGKPDYSRHKNILTNATYYL